MQIEVQVTIEGSRDKVWSVITDIEQSPTVIQGIEQIELLERPSQGLVGLKWQETRTLFGKTATEVMWITDAQENEFYQTRAESHGAVYTTRLALSEQDGRTRLTMTFCSVAQTLGAKLMYGLMGRMFRKATQDALQQDLADIKAAVEGAGQG